MNAKILETENVTVSFDGFKALNQLNFSMDAGELRVVIGPNGAGKTTFLDVITGKVQPTLGRVLFKTVLPDGIVGWLRSQNISLFHRHQQIVTYPTLEEDPEVQHERENIGN